MAAASLRNVLVTGTNRGIGFEIVRQLLTSEPRPDHIFATHRSPLGTESTSALEKLATEKGQGRIHLVQLDVTDEASIASAQRTVRSVVGEAGLNVLFNNSAVCVETDRMEQLTAAEMMNHYRVNSVGPVLMTQALMPLLKQAAELEVNKAEQFGWKRAAVVHISSFSGSIGTKEENWRMYSYKASKAALNMLGSLMCEELTDAGVATLLLCPGHVRTDMGGPAAPLSPEESVAGILEVSSRLDADTNGKFMNLNGQFLEW